MPIILTAATLARFLCVLLGLLLSCCPLVASCLLQEWVRQGLWTYGVGVLRFPCARCSMAFAEGVAGSELHRLLLRVLNVLGRREVGAMAIEVELASFATGAHASRSWVGFRSIVNFSAPGECWLGGVEAFILGRACLKRVRALQREGRSPPHRCWWCICEGAHCVGMGCFPTLFSSTKAWWTSLPERAAWHWRTWR